MRFDSEQTADIAFAALNSNLFYLYFSMLTDTRHINPSDVRDFPLGLDSMSRDNKTALLSLARQLRDSFDNNIVFVNKSGLKIESIDTPKLKPIIDEIDALLAKHYGFTEEELDFIVNYDIKYRMGDELAGVGD